MKFAESSEEAHIIDKLKEIDQVSVKKSVRYERILVKQIEKWLRDDDIVSDFAENNNLDPDQVKLIRVLDKSEFKTKRAILSITILSLFLNKFIH